MTYRRAPVKAPRLSGMALKAMVNTLERGGVGPALVEKLMRDSGIEQWRELSAGDAPPIQYPLPPGAPPSESQTPVEQAARAVAASPVTPKQQTVAAFARAYRDGSTDPVAVTHKVHEAIERLDVGADRLGLFIARKPEEVLRAAEASAERLRAGMPLSVLDGVPVVIKDELDLAGFPTTLGTTFRTEPVQADSTVAARLKAAGAVILGKANMQEIGINPIGLNPHHGAARNPWNRGHITGGSSSGSGAVVAAGLCPVSIGADGGGSIRIPAALCGIVGLKATWGRIPETGVPPLCWNVAHVGPLGLTVDDVAAAYAIVAGPDGHDVVARQQPPHHLSGYEDGALKGVRMGICTPYFEDADADVVARCREAVRALTDAGATVVELPAPDLNTILWTHSCIILSEMAEAMLPQVKARASVFGLDSRTNLALGRHFRATDLIHALRHRHRLTRELLALMEDVDVIVTPTTASTAPAIPEATLPAGESNLPVVDALMRFIRLANLTGCPALSVPAGFDRAGLPVGVHLMGRPYEEHLLLRLGRVVERASERRTPGIHVNVLP
ncbi:amidase [Corallococcus exiguus]|uniref:amidase n=1 Tax=Corallococcus TaxID=83461 RepID=UPI000EC20524|nr:MULTISPECIES: amidase [Corallococcus]NNB89318.1 amidase [Corallococcus exiguus]NNB96902.1 amidase [Corallococcus exiguus]NNC04794.1 amidase [Corallococcus exiguus]NPC49678.1 amidase [Corallococcus exiguus]RKH76365.1 amidase [Corallococcus sp. AB032C]